MKKNAVVIIIIAIILILIGVAVYLFVKGSKKGKNLDKDGKIIDPTKDKDGKLLLLEKTPEVTPPLATTPTPTPPPTYTTPTTLLPCTKDAFPMGMKAKNQCVQRLQQKLKLDDDGKFGKNTNTAVLALGFVVPLTEADFDKIIAGQPATTAPTTTTTTTTPLSLYEQLIRKIGTGSATKRYYNPNYVRVRYDAGWTRAELSFFFYDDYQTSTTTLGKQMSLPADTKLIIKNGTKVVAYGFWLSDGNFTIYDIVMKGGKLVAGKGEKYFFENNIWENIKAFESAIQ